MMLSEAIRLGSMLHSQAFNTIAVQGPDGEVIATCAMGAIWAALHAPADTLAERQAQWKKARSDTAWWNFSGCPYRLIVAIIFKNDRERWTREHIAEWIVTSGQDVELELPPASSAVTTNEGSLANAMSPQ